MTTLSFDKKSVNFDFGGQLDNWQVAAIESRGNSEEIGEYLTTQIWSDEAIEEFLQFLDSELYQEMDFEF